MSLFFSVPFPHPYPTVLNNIIPLIPFLHHLVATVLSSGRATHTKSHNLYDGVPSFKLNRVGLF
jgi:hypothetical protein